jgi:predicted Zn-dependent protease
VHQRYALDFLVPLGRTEQARAVIERARALEPMSLPIQFSVGVVKNLTGDIPGAVAELENLTATYPDFVMGHYFLGCARRDAGDYDAALSALECAIEKAGSGGSPEMISARAQVLARRGDADAARSALKQVADATDSGGSHDALLAQIHASLGDTESAVAALQRAAENREAELIYLNVRPVYAPLREDARVKALLARVGLDRATRTD